MNAHTLDQELETLEQRWVAILSAERGDKPPPGNASGEIQFFSTDFPSTYVGATDEPLPAKASGSALRVVCIGMTHNKYKSRADTKLIPHIYTHSHGETWTVDVARTRSTRRALNTAIAAYAMNRRAWAENGYASDECLVPSDWDGREAEYPLVVIKTYLSPFLATKPWAEYKGLARREMLDAWDPNRHLCDLIQTLGNNVDLWVIHGNSLWPHFIKSSHHMAKWMLTVSLTYVSQQNRSIETFWKTRGPEGRRLPSFPSC